ncbi:Dpp4p, partial [Linderina macrospora]
MARDNFEYTALEERGQPGVTARSGGPLALDAENESLQASNFSTSRLERGGSGRAGLDGASLQDFGEEDDARFYDEFTMYDPHNAKTQVWKRKRFTLLHILLVVVGCLGVFAAASSLWRAMHSKELTPVSELPLHEGKSSAPAVPDSRSGKKLLTYNNVGKVSSLVERKDVDWIAHPTDRSIDGLYREYTGLSFDILSISNATYRKTLATTAQVIKASVGLMDTFYIESWTVSADWEYILFNTKSERVWRYGVKGTYFVYNVKERTMIPLTSEGNGRIRYVQWAPAGHRLLFVRDNDIYVTDMMKEIRVTEDGSDDVFNGIADWVYAEEVLATDSASWWSPDGEVLAYLRLDDSKVPLYQYQIFHPENHTITYPDSIRLHYPKPGAPNPQVSLHVYRPDFRADSPDVKPVTKASDNTNTDFQPHPITFDNAFKPNDMIVARVTWLTDKHDKLMVHAFNRVQDHQRVYLASADPKQLVAKMVRERSTSAKQGGDDAWIEISSSPVFVPANTVEGVGSDGYIEIVENGEYTHLALFDSLEATKPARWLTSGDWDVISGTAVLDRKDANVYYASTQQSSTKSTIYRVALNAKNAAGSAPQLVSPPDIKSSSEILNAPGAREGTYDAKFSTSGGFFLLNYKGPHIPWQAVYSSHDAKFERILTDNAGAHSEFEKYDLPTVDFFEVPNEAGDKMNAMALYPPGFDKTAKNKYGVLLRVYGGPNSQQVSHAFSLDWHSALVSQQDVPDMPFIVAVVDGRGTAHKGRKFRSSVSKHLGEFEPDDQAAAAKYFQSLPYINRHRMAIWG